MIYEQGRVLAVKADSVWVETINQSACQKCHANQGCGHGLLTRLGAKQSYLKVPISEACTQKLVEGDKVIIGIESSAVIKASLVAYLTPLIMSLMATIFMHNQVANDFWVVIAAAMGFFAGILFVRWFSRRREHDSRYQPVLIMRCPELMDPILF